MHDMVTGAPHSFSHFLSCGRADGFGALLRRDDDDEDEEEELGRFSLSVAGLRSLERLRSSRPSRSRRS